MNKRTRAKASAAHDKDVAEASHDKAVRSAWMQRAESRWRDDIAREELRARPKVRLSKREKAEIRIRGERFRKSYARRYKMRTNPSSIIKSALPIAGWYLGSKVATNFVAKHINSIGAAVLVGAGAYLISSQSVVGTFINLIDTVVGY